MDYADERHRMLDSLKLLGLTRYEGEVYTALLSVDDATATEIHDLSGVPRASVYPVLVKLEQKNMVFLSHSTPKRFRAVDPKKAIAMLLEEIHAGSEHAQRILTNIYISRRDIHNEQNDCIWHLRSAEQVKTHLGLLFRDARQSLYVLAGESFLSEFVVDLIPVTDQFVRVTVITQQCSKDPIFPPSVQVHNLPSGEGLPVMDSEGMGLLLADASRVLMVMEEENHDISALYSSSPALVSFFQKYWNSIMRCMLRQDRLALPAESNDQDPGQT